MGIKKRDTCEGIPFLGALLFANAFQCKKEGII